MNNESDEEDVSGDSKEREVVLPGELLSEEKYKAGVGTYSEDGKIFASQLGIVNFRSNFVNVIPLGGKFIPRVGDQVIGIVMDVGPSNWLVDINSPYPAPMHISEAPWKIEFGDTGRYLNVGDMILSRILMVDEVKHVQVTMRDHGLRKLQGGQVLEISYSKVPRVIGRNGSMIQMIKNYTGCRIIVGQNGRIWLDGDFESITLAIKAINMIDKEAQRMGLTDKLREFLERAGRKEE